MTSLKSILTELAFLYLLMDDGARKRGRPSGSGVRLPTPRHTSSGNSTHHCTGARDSRTLSQGSSFSSGLVQSALANSRDPYRGHRGVQLFASIDVEHFDPELEALDGIPSNVFFNKIRVHVPPCRFTQSRARHAN